MRFKYALVLILAAAAVAVAAAAVAGNFNRTVEPKEPLCICSFKEVRPCVWKLVFLNQEVEADLTFWERGLAEGKIRVGRAAHQAR